MLIGREAPGHKRRWTRGQTSRVVLPTSPTAASTRSSHPDVPSAEKCRDAASQARAAHALAIRLACTSRTHHVSSGKPKLPPQIASETARLRASVAARAHPSRRCHRATLPARTPTAAMAHADHQGRSGSSPTPRRARATTTRQKNPTHRRTRSLGRATEYDPEEIRSATCGPPSSTIAPAATVAPIKVW